MISSMVPMATTQNLLYFLCMDIFPPERRALDLAICTIISRPFQVLAPLICRTSINFALATFIVLSMIGALGGLFIISPKILEDDRLNANGPHYSQKEGIDKRQSMIS
jgi:hypothetical protein